MTGPDAPASGFLVESDAGGAFVMDMGPGAFGQLQKYRDPVTVDLLLSHLHADHCLDIPGLLIWRKFHPTSPAAQKNDLWGPADTAARVGRAAAETSDGCEDISDTFDVHNLAPHKTFEVAGMTVTAYPMVHPIEAYGFRIELDGAVVAYTGDTAWTDEIVTMAQDADILICEATWCDSDEGKPEAMHMTGAEAGKAARLAGVTTLVLTHIPPYGDKNAALRSAESEFDGSIILASPGMIF
ncbi:MULTISPECIES: MBL fold metallo-hydrolase [unclassified Corynebacterium]|uniref:MBL fold metallo-hydrolase n=1 Tax=unclassified Corynebacterium TaxID=2624378 RepID=UPI00309774BF